MHERLPFAPEIPESLFELLCRVFSQHFLGRLEETGDMLHCKNRRAIPCFLIELEVPRWICDGVVEDVLHPLFKAEFFVHFRSLFSRPLGYALSQSYRLLLPCHWKHSHRHRHRRHEQIADRQRRQLLTARRGHCAAPPGKVQRELSVREAVGRDGEKWHGLATNSYNVTCVRWRCVIQSAGECRKRCAKAYIT